MEEAAGAGRDEDLVVWGDPKPPVRTGNAYARIVDIKCHMLLGNLAMRRSALSVAQ